MRFRDIPPLTKHSGYAVDIGWDYLPKWLDEAIKEDGLDLSPDFQRGHVWTEAQQIAYVEYALRDGSMTGKDLYFNHPGWQKGNRKGPYVIVDGLQRLTAVMRFLRNEIPAYGALHNEYEDKMRMVGPKFRWHINDLPNRTDVLKWYLEFNSGGTPHTQDELNRVRGLLDSETRRRVEEA